MTKAHSIASRTLTSADTEYLLMLSPAKRIEALVGAALRAAACLDQWCARNPSPWEIEHLVLQALQLQLAVMDEGCPPERM